MSVIAMLLLLDGVCSILRRLCLRLLTLHMCEGAFKVTTLLLMVLQMASKSSLEASECVGEGSGRGSGTTCACVVGGGVASALVALLLVTDALDFVAALSGDWLLHLQRC